ncbi:signal peptidase I [Peribacillus sp. NPDC097264]|uniref:signal peptidase I n=1 Tax=Peribacillus sp. NPDC097264 TaxID=3390616 RepID=UPI003D046F8E
MLFDKETVDLFKTVVKKEGSFHLPAQGNSMYPFIKSGDICYFNECKLVQLKKGDIVLFYSETKRLIAHRYYKEMKNNQQRQFLFKGDTNLGYDQPIHGEQIVGKLLFVQKRNTKLYVSSFLAKTWGKLIMSVPMLTIVLQRYINFQRRKKGGVN